MSQTCAYVFTKGKEINNRCPTLTVRDPCNFCQVHCRKHCGAEWENHKPPGKKAKAQTVQTVNVVDEVIREQRPAAPPSVKGKTAVVPKLVRSAVPVSDDVEILSMATWRGDDAPTTVPRSEHQNRRKRRKHHRV